MKPKLKHVGWCLTDGKEFVYYSRIIRGWVRGKEIDILKSERDVILLAKDFSQKFKPAKVFVETR